MTALWQLQYEEKVLVRQCLHRVFCLAVTFSLSSSLDIWERKCFHKSDIKLSGGSVISKTLSLGCPLPFVASETFALLLDLDTSSLLTDISYTFCTNSQLFGTVIYTTSKHHNTIYLVFSQWWRINEQISASIHPWLLSYSLVLVLGALKMCMVLLDGVEDHTADAAGVTTAQPWRDRNARRTGYYEDPKTENLKKSSAWWAAALPTINALFLTRQCWVISLIRVHLEKIWLG